MVEGGHGEAEEHRDLRPHRLGEDDAHRTDPLLHGEDPRDPRGEGAGWSRGKDGFHGFGEGEGNHDPIGCYLLHLEWLPGW